MVRPLCSLSIAFGLAGRLRVRAGFGHLAHFDPTHIGDKCDLAGQLRRVARAGLLLVLSSPAVRSGTIGCGLVAFFGMILLCSSSLHIGSQRLMGDALAVLTAGFYAAYLIVMAAARERAAASSLAFASSLLCSATLLPIVFLAGEDMLPTAVVDWVWLIGLAVISQVLGQTAIAHALGRIPPAQAAIGLLIQPVSAAVFAWVLFGESNVRSSTLGRRCGACLHHRRAPFRALEDSIPITERTFRMATAKRPVYREESLTGHCRSGGLSCHFQRGWF